MSEFKYICSSCDFPSMVNNESCINCECDMYIIITDNDTEFKSVDVNHNSYMSNAKKWHNWFNQRVNDLKRCNPELEFKVAFSYKQGLVTANHICPLCNEIIVFPIGDDVKCRVIRHGMFTVPLESTEYNLLIHGSIDKYLDKSSDMYKSCNFKQPGCFAPIYISKIEENYLIYKIQIDPDYGGAWFY